MREIARLDDAVRALHAERDENTCRKDFSPTEAVAIGRQIEEMVRPMAEERHPLGSVKGGHAVSGTTPIEGVGKMPTPSEPVRARTAAAAAAGMGERTYAKAKDVIEAAEADPDTFGDLPVQLDATGNVDGTHREMTDRKQRQATASTTGGANKSKAAVAARLDRIRALAASGHNASQSVPRMFRDGDLSPRRTRPSTYGSMRSETVCLPACAVISSPPAPGRMTAGP